MKLLLTSAGITNDSIRNALENMLNKTINEAKAVVIPTAMYANPGGNSYVWQTLRMEGRRGWQELAVIELTALPSTPKEYWLPTLEEADIIIVGGGNTLYLSYWMQESGLAKILPELLQDKTYLGVSAGSMIMTHRLHVNREDLNKTGIYKDDEYDECAPLNAGSDKTLKLLDFVVRPHLNHEYFPNITLEHMEKASAKIDVPMYVIDDQTAIAVTDGDVQVISEGEWKLYEK
jgi:dipeptidase E